MNLGKDVAKRHSSVSGKSVAHSSARGNQGDGGEKHAHEREHEQAYTAGLALGRVHEDLKQRAFGSADHIIDVVDNEHQASEEDETSEHADTDAVHHNLRALLLRVRNLLNHVCHSIETC